MRSKGIESAFGQTLEALDSDIEFSPMRDFVAELKQRIENRRLEWRLRQWPTRETCKRWGQAP